MGWSTAEISHRELVIYFFYEERLPWDWYEEQKQVEQALTIPIDLYDGLPSPSVYAGDSTDWEVRRTVLTLWLDDTNACDLGSVTHLQVGCDNTLSFRRSQRP